METSPIPVVTVQTAPYDDQRPGTSGLRRKTTLFEGKKNYLQNYIQSLLSSIDLRDRQGCTMVVGSDGRYFSRAAIEVIVQMAAANGVRMEGGEASSALHLRFLPHVQVTRAAPLIPVKTKNIKFSVKDASPGGVTML